MNQTILISTLLAALMLTACDKPTVVTVPAETIVVPGPAGPPGEAGATGDQGDPGVQGDTGEAGVDGAAGTGTTEIVVPPSDPNAPPSN